MKKIKGPSDSRSGMGADALQTDRLVQGACDLRLCVDRRLAVIAVPCRVRWRYNLVTALHGVDRTTTNNRAISIEHNEVAAAIYGEKSEFRLSFNVGFDQANFRLSQYSAGRGLGGTYTEWAWTGERFALTLPPRHVGISESRPRRLANHLSRRRQLKNCAGTMRTCIHTRRRDTNGVTVGLSNVIAGKDHDGCLFRLHSS